MRLIIVAATIFFFLLAAASLIYSALAPENWFSNLFLNFGTEMLGAVVTFVVIGVIVGGREAQQRQAEQERLISTLLREEIRKAFTSKPDVSISAADLSIVERRLERVAPLFDGLRILWIDDIPANNVNESNLLKELGVHVDHAISSQEAARLLDRMNYDLVITDMGRDNNNSEGMDFFLLRNEQGKPLPPTIFYMAYVKYTEHTGKAFGSTNRPDELFHLIMDVVERIRA
jgi:CheY-like chemotaxis protein